MPPTSKEMQDKAQQILMEARWPILVKRFLQASSLVNREEWADLEAQLTEERRRMAAVLSSKGISERDSDELRGGIGVLDWLLRLKEDVKEFHK